MIVYESRWRWRCQYRRGFKEGNLSSHRSNNTSAPNKLQHPTNFSKQSLCIQTPTLFPLQLSLLFRYHIPFIVVLSWHSLKREERRKTKEGRKQKEDACTNTGRDTPVLRKVCACLEEQGKHCHLLAFCTEKWPLITILRTTIRGGVYKPLIKCAKVIIFGLEWQP